MKNSLISFHFCQDEIHELPFVWPYIKQEEDSMILWDIDCIGRVSIICNVEVTKFKSYSEEYKRKLVHYSLECHVIAPFRSLSMRYRELCNYFI